MASAISRAFINDDAQRVDLATIGAKSAFIGLISIVQARKFLQLKEFDLLVVPVTANTNVDGEDFTKVIFQLYKTDINVHLQYVGAGDGH